MNLIIIIAEKYFAVQSFLSCFCDTGVIKLKRTYVCIELRDAWRIKRKLRSTFHKIESRFDESIDREEYDDEKT